MGSIMSNKICIFAQLAGGKDTVANYLVKQLNSRRRYLEDKWQRIGFADALKKVFMSSFDVSWDFIEEWKRKDEVPPNFDLNIRKSLQQIGDGFRKIQSDVWIRTAIRNKFNMVISDGRYLNEAKMVREQGGFNILLWRPGFENNDPNPSESQIKPFVDYFANNCYQGTINDLPILDPPFDGLQYFDYFLINDGGLDDLYKRIDNSLIHDIGERGLL
jgi:hypothetical protein